MLPWIGSGLPVPHAWQDGQASSVFQLNWKSRKSPFRRCFKPPLPRLMPLESTTTGTCEIGQDAT
jgi:hypothetical protein